MARRKKTRPTRQARATIVKRVDYTEAEKMKNGYLDMLQSQAADKFYELYIHSQISGQGIDYARDKVDGGPVWSEIPDRVLASGSKLANASKVIGRGNYNIIHWFTCDGSTSAQVAARKGESGDRAEKYYRPRYRDALTELADHWFPTRLRPNHIRSVMAEITPWVYQDTGS